MASPAGTAKCNPGRRYSQRRRSGQLIGEGTQRYAVVPAEGVEPTHPYGYQILSLARLPIPPHRQPSFPWPTCVFPLCLLDFAPLLRRETTAAAGPSQAGQTLPSGKRRAHSFAKVFPRRKRSVCELWVSKSAFDNATKAAKQRQQGTYGVTPWVSAEAGQSHSAAKLHPKWSAGLPPAWNDPPRQAGYQRRRFGPSSVGRAPVGPVPAPGGARQFPGSGVLRLFRRLYSREPDWQLGASATGGGRSPAHPGDGIPPLQLPSRFAEYGRGCCQF